MSQGHVSHVADVLIEPAELAELLNSSTPPVLADVRWTLGGPPGKGEYEAGHLPGAHWVDLETELSSPTGAGGRHPLPRAEAFEAAMRRIGVGPDRLVVAYDGDTGVAAARLWWLLLDAGHDLVRVLDGGYTAWIADGRPVQLGSAEAVAPGDFRAVPGRLGRIDGAELAARVAGADPPPLVDVRAHERYTGESEPIDPVAGHIPGALNRPSLESLDASGRFRSPAELAERYADIAHGAVLYCGSGVTAAHSLLALRVAGRADARIYPGSWSDWITDPNRPVATGEEPG